MGLVKLLVVRTPRRKVAEVTDRRVVDLARERATGVGMGVEHGIVTHHQA
jgi:hypothetical protein